MLEGSISIKDSMWYKEDGIFKNLVNSSRKMLQISRQTDLFGKKL